MMRRIEDWNKKPYPCGEINDPTDGRTVIMTKMGRPIHQQLRWGIVRLISWLLNVPVTLDLDLFKRDLWQDLEDNEDSVKAAADDAEIRARIQKRIDESRRKPIDSRRRMNDRSG